jgi:hypothetical protein
MGIQDDIFDVELVLKQAGGKNSDKFDRIVEYLSDLEWNNEQAFKMIMAVANGEKALEEIRRYFAECDKRNAPVGVGHKRDL